MTPKRIPPQETQTAMAAGALLVAVMPQAAYDRQHPEGAISWQEFERRAPSLAKTHSIVFY